VRQNIDEDCAQDQIDDNLRNRAHVLPPNFDDDDRKDNGDQNGHPIDRTHIELHLFLPFFLAECVESPHYGDAYDQDCCHSLGSTASSSNGGQHEDQCDFPHKVHDDTVNR